MTATSPSAETQSTNSDISFAPSGSITDVYINSKNSVIDPVLNGQLAERLTISDYEQPEHGFIKRSDDGSFLYTPHPDYAGPDSFVCSAINDAGDPYPVTIYLAVLPYAYDAATEINQLPDAKWDSVQTSFNQAVNINVLGNDKDPDLDTLSIVEFTHPAHGVLSRLPDGSFDYQPADGFAGQDEFTYTISDGHGGFDTARVNITVNPVEDGPSASNDAAQTTEGQAILIDVLKNDNDPQGDSLTLVDVMQPTGGSVELTEEPGVILFTPDDGFTGEVFFPYWISDSDGNRAEAVVSVVVNKAVESPNKPIASDDEVTTEENQPVTIKALDNDSSGDSKMLTLYGFGQPNHGSVTLDVDGNFIYSPEADFSGDDRFGYTIVDEHGNKTTASVFISVSAINEAPVSVGTEFSTNEDTALPIDLSDLVKDPDGDALTIESLSANNGSVSLEADGTLLYVPEQDFNGPDKLLYRVSDPDGAILSGEAVLTVHPVNDTPVALDDEATTNKGSAIQIDVLNNDSDPDHDALSIESFEQAANGKVTLLDDGSLSYDPNPEFFGQDSFCYTVSDGNGGTSSATVNVAVMDVNTPPDARNHSLETEEGMPILIRLADHVSDPDKDPVSLDHIVTQPLHGSLDVAANGDITYMPEDQFHGFDGFGYRVSDGRGGSDSAWVNIEVVPVNADPVVDDNKASTQEATPVIISLLDQASDADGDAVSIDAIVSEPAHGSISIDEHGQATYTPEDGFSGFDGFGYRVSDGHGGYDTAWVNIEVTATNEAPVAESDHAETKASEPLILDVLANDSDPDGDALKIIDYTQADHGQLTLNDDGSFLYEPDQGFSGYDCFSYVVSDDEGAIDVAKVKVNVVAVNQPPIASDDMADTLEDHSVTVNVLENDTDADGDGLAIKDFDQPDNGLVTLNENGQFTYTPDDDFNGQDSFHYRITDGSGEISDALVIVNVTPVNDLPNAIDNAVTTQEDTPVTINALANDIDPDGDSLTVESYEQPSHGTVTLNDDGSFNYVPADQFSGEDGFTYTVTDNHGGSSSAAVQITVEAINDAPKSEDDAITTSQATPVTISALANDHDPDGDSLSIQSFEQPAHGTVMLNDDGTLLYSPDPQFAGEDSFSYTAKDGNGGSDNATVTIRVEEVRENLAPVAEKDQVSTLQGEAVVINALGNDSDPDGDPLFIAEFDQPKHGTVTINDDGSLTYLPDPKFSGKDYFYYTITDGKGGFDKSKVYVKVEEVSDNNAAPNAEKDLVSTTQGEAVVINALGNDSDPDGDPLFIAEFDQPKHGTVTINDDGSLTYLPDPKFSGKDYFYYTITDGKGGFDKSKVYVKVEEVSDNNAAPNAEKDLVSTTQGEAVVINALGNDSDPDGDPLFIAEFDQPKHGTVTINDDGSLTYLPDPKFSGKDYFYYTITDGKGGFDKSKVYVKVEEVNENSMPDAQDDQASTERGQSVVIQALANDVDADDDMLMVSEYDNPVHGTVLLNNDGSFIYTPDDGFTGNDSFNYRVTDGKGGFDVATVLLTVTGDTPPVCAKLTGVNEIQEGAAGSYRVELNEALDHDAWFQLKVTDGTANRVDHSAADQDVMWGGYFDTREGIGGKLTGIYEDMIPNGQRLSDGMREASGPGDTSWDYGIVKDNVLVQGNTVWVKIPTGETLSDSLEIQAWNEQVTVDRDAGTADGHLEGMENFSIGIAGSDKADEVEVCDADLTVNIQDATAYHYVSPIALDLNRDGQIGVTGNSSAKERAHTSEIGETVRFDIDADGEQESIEWLKGDGDAMLVDNRDGLATELMDGSRLFGDQGGEFEHGYEKLAELDLNGDGQLNGEELRGLDLWSDDGDAIVEAGEMASLFDHGITALSTEMRPEANMAGETLMRSTAMTESGEELTTEDVWFAAESLPVNEILDGDSSLDQLLDSLPAEQLSTLETTGGIELSDNSCDRLDKLAELYEEQTHDIAAG
ncbi:MAG: Ig-like domain-containing protein [Thiotrichales bacterium]